MITSNVLFCFIAVIKIAASYGGRGGINIHLDNSTIITLSDNNGCCNNLNIVGEDVGNKRYFVEWNYRTNFFGAMEFCRSHGMRLATISSEEEHTALEGYIRRLALFHEQFWTSGNDLVKQGSYNWLSSGAPMIYRNFFPAQPDNAVSNAETEHCVHLWSIDGKVMKWNDHQCSQQKMFVCELML